MYDGTHVAAFNDGAAGQASGVVTFKDFTFGIPLTVQASSYINLNVSSPTTPLFDSSNFSGSSATVLDDKGTVQTKMYNMNIQLAGAINGGAGHMGFLVEGQGQLDIDHGSTVGIGGLDNNQTDNQSYYQTNGLLYLSNGTLEANKGFETIGGVVDILNGTCLVQSKAGKLTFQNTAICFGEITRRCKCRRQRMPTCS
jgi:hypothetical protein